MKTKQYFLILASLAVTPIALGYGTSPEWFARTFFGVAELDLNFAHILRAVMCLYLALGLFWLFSAFSDKYRNAAVLTIVIFCVGLAFGRIFSVILDGRPAPILFLYLAVEVVLVPVALWVWWLPDE